jgi:hypothetical protein
MTARVKGAKFLWLEPDWILEIDAIRDVIKKGLAVAGKGR